MHTGRRLLFLAPLALLLCQCNMLGGGGTKYKPTRMDSTMDMLRARNPVPIQFLKDLHIIDGHYLHLEQMEAGVDTTVMLGKDVFYSVITLSDMKHCSYRFILSINQKTKKSLDAKLLRPDCDIDYTRPSYDLYKQKYISKDSILLEKTTVYQHVVRVSNDPNENVDSQALARKYFIIGPDGLVRETPEVAAQ